METTFTWLIEWMHVVPQDGDLTDVVLSAGWRCNGTDGTHYGTLYGSCVFARPDGDFTPYEQLTQEQVLNWCWSEKVDRQAVETAVKVEVESQQTPDPAIKPLPWN